MVHRNHILKAGPSSLFTLQPISTSHCKISLYYFDLWFAHMACLGISLGNLLPAWLKRFVAIPSSDRSYTSSPRNISTPEGRGSPASHRNSVNSRTGYVSGTIDLPSPARMPTLSKSAMDDEYHMWKPFACNQTLPLPMTRSQARRKPSAVYSSILGMLFIQALFILFWVLCTNPVGVNQFLKYEGVRYQPGSPYYLWLFVKYDDSAVGYVGVPSFSFNADVSLQRKLKKLVPQNDWKYLEEKYGFGFINHIL